MQLNDSFSSIPEREVYPIDRHLRHRAKMDLNFTYVPNTPILSSMLIAYAKTEKDLRTVEEEHMHLTRNLNLVYSGHYKLVDFLNNSLSHKKYSDSNASEFKISSKSKVTSEQKKSNKKPDKSKDQNRKIIRNIVLSSTKGVNTDPRNSFVKTIPSVNYHPYDDSKFKNDYFSEERLSSFNRKKINQSLEASIKHGFNNTQKLVKGVDGKLIPLLSNCDDFIWTEPIIEGQEIEVEKDMGDVNKILKLHSQIDISRLKEDSQTRMKNVTIQQTKSLVSLPHDDNDGERDDGSTKNVTKHNIGDENKLMTHSQLQSDETKPDLEKEYDARDTVDQADSENEFKEWNDFSYISTPVATEVDSNPKMNEDVIIEELPSDDEDPQSLSLCGDEFSLHTPLRSASPSMKSEDVEIKSKEMKIYKESSVSPVSFLCESQSHDAITSDYTENEVSALTDCSTTLNEHISEGQILLSEGELNKNIINLLALEKTICSGSGEDERYFEETVNLPLTHSIGEVHMFRKSSISEGEIIQMDDYQEDSSINESYNASVREDDDSTGMLLSNVGSLLTELAATGSTHRDNSLIQN